MSPALAGGFLTTGPPRKSKKDIIADVVLELSLERSMGIHQRHWNLSLLICTWANEHHSQRREIFRGVDVKLGFI